MTGRAGAGFGLMGVLVFLDSGFLGDDGTAGFLVVVTTCWRIIRKRLKQSKRSLFVRHIAETFTGATFKTP